MIFRPPFVLPPSNGFGNGSVRNDGVDAAASQPSVRIVRWNDSVAPDQFDGPPSRVRV